MKKRGIFKGLVKGLKEALTYVRLSKKVGDKEAQRKTGIRVTKRRKK